MRQVGVGLIPAGGGTKEMTARAAEGASLTSPLLMRIQPVFETIGNHDPNESSPVKQRVRERHGGINYSWDWDDLRLSCLDMYPDAATVSWLTGELDRLGTARPVILFFHYSIEGYYADFWEEEEKEAFARAIEGLNVIAVFHGHEHGAGHYTWRGHAVFRPGAPRHSSHSFLVVRVEPNTMAVAAWDFDKRRWHSSFRKMYVDSLRILLGVNVEGQAEVQR